MNYNPDKPHVLITLTEYQNLIETKNVHLDSAKGFQEYCGKYLMPDAWGRNIFQCVLEDAIRMREFKDK